MRILIVAFVLALTACNGSSNPTPQAPSVSQADFNALQSKVDSLDADNKALKSSISSLRLVGKPVGSTATAERTLAIGSAAITAVDFGPCSNMGILIGFSNQTATSVADALAAPFQVWRQCTGYVYGTNVSDGSLQPGNRIYYDGANCTGNMYTWEAAGHAYNTQTLQGGVVFSNSDGTGGAFMVKADQTPQMTQVQSVYVFQNGGCEIDGDFQPMYVITPNDFHVTGVPDNGVGIYSLGSL